MKALGATVAFGFGQVVDACINPNRHFHFLGKHVRQSISLYYLMIGANSNFTLNYSVIFSYFSETFQLFEKFISIEWWKFSSLIFLWLEIGNCDLV